MEWIKKNKILVVIVAVITLVAIVFVVKYLELRAIVDLSMEEETETTTKKTTRKGLKAKIDSNSQSAQLLSNTSSDYDAVKNMNETLRKSFDTYAKSFDLAQAKIRSLSNDLAKANMEKFSLTQKLEEAETSHDNYVPLWQYLAIVSAQSRDIDKISEELHILRQEYDRALDTLFIGNNEISGNEAFTKEYHKTAFQLFEDNADRSTKAKLCMAYFYDPLHDKVKIDGITQNVNTAIRKYKEVSYDAEAQYLIGNLYSEKINDIDTAVKWYSWAVQSGGHDNATFMIGYIAGRYGYDTEYVLHYIRSPEAINTYNEGFLKGRNDKGE